MAQVYNNRSLTDEQVSSMISGRNADTYVKVFELLPQFIKNSDSNQVIKGFMEAVQSEYDISRDSITEILAIVDPRKVNTKFSLEGNFVFFHPEQFVYGGTFANGPASVEMTGPVTGPPASGFYRDFGVYIWEDSTNPTAVGQYRKIISYDGATRTALMDEEWDVVPSQQAVMAMCWPDRVWLPTAIVSDARKPGATIFPSQKGPTLTSYEEDYGPGKFISLPGLAYLATIDDYYVGWTIDFLDGVNSGKSAHIDQYFATDKVLLVSGSIESPAENDWFRLSPPGSSLVSVIDNFYKGKWLQVSAANDSDISYSQGIRKQVREIIRSEYSPLSTPASHVAYVYDPLTNSGKEFDHPPPPVSLYGISNSYVPLAHLASYVGIELDDEDPEFYQREQISQAYSFHKLRGTRRALELVCRSFGFDVEIDEATSNYVPAGGKLIYPNLAAPHRQYNSSVIDELTKAGLGLGDVPTEYLTLPGMLTARIPDSDIRIYLERTNQRTSASFGSILKRILKKLELYVPIHVQIIFVGLLTRIKEPVSVNPQFGVNISIFEDEAVSVSSDLYGTPIGEVPVSNSYELAVSDPIEISSPARYSLGSARFGRNTIIPGPARWTRGNVARI